MTVWQTASARRLMALLSSIEPPLRLPAAVAQGLGDDSGQHFKVQLPSGLLVTFNERDLSISPVRAKTYFVQLKIAKPVVQFHSRSLLHDRAAALRTLGLPSIYQPVQSAQARLTQTSKLIPRLGSRIIWLGRPITASAPRRIRLPGAWRPISRKAPVLRNG